MKIIVIADEDELVGQLPEQKAMGRYGCPKAFAVKGNHDSSGKFKSNVEDLHLSVVEYQGLKFGGFEGSWKYKPNGNYLYEQDYVEKVLSSFPRVDIFIAHNSPWGIHQRDEETHQGFRGFLSYIEKTQPGIFLHGHQHVNSQTKLGNTEIVGVYGEQVIEIE